MVNMPPAGAWEDEVQIQQQQLEVLNTLDDFLASECDSRGRPIGMNNLNTSQAKGRKEILNGVKAGKFKL